MQNIQSKTPAGVYPHVADKRFDHFTHLGNYSRENVWKDTECVGAQTIQVYVNSRSM